MSTEFEKVLQSFDLPKPIQTTPLTGGANNRVFKLDFENENPLIIKQYFSHPNDQRPRLHSEFSFLQYAWNTNIRNIPEPIAFSTKLNTAIYSFVAGRSIEPSDISDNLIKGMIDFFLAINQNKDQGQHLPVASEACMSIKNYISITDQRLERLKSFSNQEQPLYKDLSSFIQDCLLPKWLDYKNKISLYYSHAIDPQDFCISPSDFGLHNALIADSLKVNFIDFEYAGWDDPCKTVCDLFCQPKIPIPDQYFSLFAQTFSSVVSNSEACLERIHYLLPAIQMKWCCILLNAFTKIGKERRIFSYSNEVAHLENQLNKAKNLFLKIQEPVCLT